MFQSQDDLICPICRDTFTIPKQLPCRHCFCRDCLQNFIISSATEADFKCPVCRQPVIAPKPSVPKDIWVDQFSSAEKQDSLDAILKTKDKEIAKREVCQQRNTRMRICKNVTAKHLLTINVRVESDERPCKITGATFLTDERIVLADSHNHKIKLFTANGNFIEQEMSAKPFDLDVVNSTEIAVVQDGSVTHYSVCGQCLRVMSRFDIESKEYTGDSFSVGGKCRGVCYMYASTRYAVCSAEQNNNRLVVCDRRGHDARDIGKDRQSRRQFNDIRYVTNDPIGHDIFVSDTRNPSVDSGTITDRTGNGRGIPSDKVNKSGCVTSFSPDGRVKWEKAVTNPQGLASSGGHVFVANWTDHTIHMFTTNGEYVCDLATSADGIHYPQAVCVNYAGDKLLVTQSPPSGSDEIHIFTLFCKTDSSKSKRRSSACNIL